MKNYSLYLMSITIGILAAFAVVMAAGGQNQWNNPIFSDGCVAQLPPGIDLNTCEESTANPVSGQVTLFCENITVTVICPDDGPQAPGQNK